MFMFKYNIIYVYVCLASMISCWQHSWDFWTFAENGVAILHDAGMGQRDKVSILIFLQMGSHKITIYYRFNYEW